MTLQVLRKIEELKVRNVTGESYRSQLDATLKANISDSNVDVLSHFILRAAYCRTEELRRWFLTQEVYLFKHRLERLPESSLQNILKKVNLNKVSKEKKDKFREQLLSVPGVTIGDFTSTPYYAIPFTQALDLVASRSCFVNKGLAYVPLPKVVSILSAKFRMALSRSLVFASAAFNEVEEEGRIAPLLKTMNSHYTGNNRYTEQSSLGDHDINAANIDSLSKSMPLCMSQLHAGLKREHKLKHWGRLQYGLFLKGAGMSMEESLIFFQREFSKIMTSEQFNKNYAYNVRHMYGKEGKRASYTPYNCKKIIMGQPPQSGEHHGCPYRHYDDQHLASLLQKLNIGTAADRGEILRLKRGNNHQLACLKHFEVMHPNALSVPNIDLDNVGNHPNAWFSASVSYHAKNSPTKPKEPDQKVVSPEKLDSE
jgi:DNA primase large subunit